ncbi:MAG: enoyl-CoA hydratase/isomerase family protein [Candidatus Bipolaricaulota bacterium]
MNTSFDNLNLEISGDGVARLELSRPKSLNSLNDQLRSELFEAFQLMEDRRVRVVTLWGEGKAFCAGADVSEFLEIEPSRYSQFMGDFFELPEKFPAPTVAIIDGYALGGGLELAMACDLRIATTRSRLGQPEIGLGLIPGGGGTQRLTRLIGMGRAKELVMTGKQISGEKAEEWGLVNKIVEEGELEDAVKDFVEPLVKGPRKSLQMAKKVINQGASSNLQVGLEIEKQGFSTLLGSEEAREGIDAFLNDREPDFD